MKEEKTRVKFEITPEMSREISESFRRALQPMAELGRQMEEARKAHMEYWKKVFEPIRVFHEKYREQWLAFARKWDEMNVKNEESYEVQYRSLFYYLTKNGYIIPADYKEFADWFFMVKHLRSPLTSRLLAELSNVTPSDFREFHEYKEQLFFEKKGIETLELPVANLRQTVETLPVFEEALMEPDNLPQIWKRLSGLKKPFVSENGNFIWEGRRHAVLLAFAQALRSQDKLRADLSAEKVYFILCARFEVRPTSSIRQVRRGKRDFQEYLETFIDALKEL